ncbi:MAG TPA: glycosyl hydrolase family 18 protein [Terriglobia bacterium]|nr:glycosyl hydrolase family 18 protein [Terriglobia bacterium]
MATKNKFLMVAMYACPGFLALLLGAAYPAASQQYHRLLPDSRRGRKVKKQKPPVVRNIYRRKVLNAHPLRMFYYYDDFRGFESLQTHGPGITVLAPQCFAVDGNGAVHGSIPARVMAAAKAARLPIMPLLFNQGFDRAAVSALLHSVAAQQRAVRAMAELADRDDDVGFQIDLENMASADHHLFTLFVKRASSRLHQNGRLLSVAVTPQFSAAKAVHQPHWKTTHDERSGPYECRALGHYADLITLMTYDHSSRNGPPGPIAGYAWVKLAVHYAIRRVPSSKLLLGLPLYGREWTTGGASWESRSLTSGAVGALIERPEVHVQWDARWRSPWFEYNDGVAQRTVWYEDSRSLKEKLSLMQQYGLRGFAAWRLGDEGPEFWPLIAASRKDQGRGSLRHRPPSVAVKQRSKIESHPNGNSASEARTGGRSGLIR